MRIDCWEVVQCVIIAVLLILCIYMWGNSTNTLPENLDDKETRFERIDFTRDGDLHEYVIRDKETGDLYTIVTVNGHGGVVPVNENNED